MKPLVSAIVLNYTTPQVTVKCVEHLQNQTIVDQMEIIVVDNHSQDDSIGVLRNRCKKYKNIHIVETPRNFGFGGGYNRGAHHAQGKYLLFNNPPKLLEDNAIEGMVQKMESDPSIGIIAPKLIHPDGTIRESARALPSPLDLIIKRTYLRSLFPQILKQYLQADIDQNIPRDVDWVIGGCFLIANSLFKDIDGFDEKTFFLFFEDTDICRRVHLQKKRVVYDPTIEGKDRKRRLSEGGILSLLCSKVGRAHIMSACKYFWKWRNLV
jgi:N-acetylglucosaminyl-diphospho-decaprenol L-rhamnosyltransferase